MRLSKKTWIAASSAVAAGAAVVGVGVSGGVASGGRAPPLLPRTVALGAASSPAGAAALAAQLPQTHYNNFDGLPCTPGGARWSDTKPPASSTAREQVKLGRYAMTYATFRAVVATRSHTLAQTTQHAAYSWSTTNHLLGSYPGLDGIKTGHTDLAGYCLMFADRRNGKYLVGIVLGDASDTVRF